MAIDRIATIDIARGIGILLVVFSHNWIMSLSRELHDIIYSFQMPLFFFLSGIFFRYNRQFLRFSVNKSDRLLKPFYVVLLSLGLLNTEGRPI